MDTQHLTCSLMPWPDTSGSSALYLSKKKPGFWSSASSTRTRTTVLFTWAQSLFTGWVYRIASSFRMVNPTKGQLNVVLCTCVRRSPSSYSRYTLTIVLFTWARSWLLKYWAIRILPQICSKSWAFIFRRFWPRKLLKGGSYWREETICRNTVYFLKFNNRL